jgi:hypothetical protein
MSKFKMQDLGEVKFCLGMKITKDPKSRTVVLIQKNYIEELLAKYGMIDAKPMTTPMKVNLNLQRLNQRQEVKLIYPSRV